MHGFLLTVNINLFYSDNLLILFPRRIIVKQAFRPIDKDTNTGVKAICLMKKNVGRWN